MQRRTTCNPKTRRPIDGECNSKYPYQRLNKHDEPCCYARDLNVDSRSMIIDIHDPNLHYKQISSMLKRNHEYFISYNGENVSVRFLSGGRDGAAFHDAHGGRVFKLLNKDSTAKKEEQCLIGLGNVFKSQGYYNPFPTLFDRVNKTVIMEYIDGFTLQEIANATAKYLKTHTNNVRALDVVDKSMKHYLQTMYEMRVCTNDSNLRNYFVTRDHRFRVIDVTKCNLKVKKEKSTSVLYIVFMSSFKEFKTFFPHTSEYCIETVLKSESVIDKVFQESLKRGLKDAIHSIKTFIPIDTISLVRVNKLH